MKLTRHSRFAVITTLFAVGFLVALPAAALAQPAPATQPVQAETISAAAVRANAGLDKFLPKRTEAIYQALKARFGPERAMEVVTFMDRYWRVAGNTGFNASLDHLQARLAEAGFVKGKPAGAISGFRIEEYPNGGNGWEPVRFDVSIVESAAGGAPERVFDPVIDYIAICINSFSTPPGGVTAPLVDVGSGADAASYATVDVKGAVVLGTANIRGLWQEAVRNRGAIGVISAAPPARYTRPDETPEVFQWGSVPYDEKARAFGFKASPRVADRLRTRLRAGAVKVKVDIETKFAPGSPGRLLVAEIPGRERPDERVVTVAHIQEPGANDDASGCGTLLEMARSLQAAIAAKAIPPPARTLTFVWGDEMRASREWLRADPSRAAGTRFMISMDMTGEDARKTGGTFLIEKEPDPSAVWPRPADPHTEWWGGRGVYKAEALKGSLLNDLYLAACLRRARDTGWNVQTNPYEGGSDHSIFLDAGIPAVLATHFTDRYYHTNLDRPDKTSPAEMANVGIATGVTAMLLASSGPDEAMAVTDLVASAAKARLALEAQQSAGFVQKASDRAAAEAGERLLMEAWRQWYVRALESVLTLPTQPPGEPLKARVRKAVEEVTAAPAAAQLSPGMQDMLRRVTAGEFGAGGRGAGAGVHWVDGGQGYTAAERHPQGGVELVRYDTATGRREVLLTAAQLTPPQLGKPLQFGEYASSPDGRWLIFATSGRPTMIRKTAYDYWVLDRTDNSWRKLGGAAAGGVLYAKLSPDAGRAAYVRDNNLFVEDLRTGAIVPLTSDGSSSIINGTSDWVYEEELSLRDAFEWSPDGRQVAYLQFDQSRVSAFSLINYTDSLYPVITTYPYPKAGQTNAAVRVGVVSAAGGPTRWMTLPGDPRNTYIARMAWAGNSDEVIVQQLNRLQNTNDVLLARAATGDTRRMFRDQDEAWVDYNRDLVWVENGARLLFTSERDGWRHAYAIARTGEARLITTGAFDLVSIAGVDQAGGWLYYTASPDNATQRYLYRSRIDGTGEPQRVTPAGATGTHTYTLSPDCRWAFHGYSRFDSPGASDLVRLPDHQVARVLQDNKDLQAKVSSILAGRSEFVQVKVGDGVTIDGWLLKPRRFDPSRKYPIVVYVYGEPASTTVNDSWGGTGRLLMSALADAGYLVASFDNRGTPAPKGRAWRKVVYGSIGVLASTEQAAALRGLAATHPFVDLSRVGVFGWSGGGSMTLNLMFRSPDLYKVGVAGAPVPDQALYDSIYQERYMGLPQENAAGYKAGSPISFADGLQGKLLVIHGTGDDNVHFQGTQRLLNRLIELNKQFSFMEYPNRRHGIGGEHLETLRYGFIEQHLPAGPK